MRPTARSGIGCTTWATCCWRRVTCRRPLLQMCPTASNGLPMRFGPPLFDHFYVTEIPYFEGVSFPGMIDLSWVTFQNTALDGFDEFFRAHEVAHQWWGNGVRPATYRDAWLSEGIASFSGLWYLQSIRKGNKEYFRFLDEYFRNIKDVRDRTGATWLGYRNASTDARYGYQALIYEKGEWVKGNAIPTYHVAWTTEATPEGKSRVRLRVTQADVPPEFQAWVLVSADLGQNRFANFRIKVTGAQSDYTSPILPFPPRSITFNELHSVLADVKLEPW